MSISSVTFKMRKELSNHPIFWTWKYEMNSSKWGLPYKWVNFLALATWMEKAGNWCPGSNYSSHEQYSCSTLLNLSKWRRQLLGHDHARKWSSQPSVTRRRLTIRAPYGGSTSIHWFCIKVISPGSICQIAQQSRQPSSWIKKVSSLNSARDSLNI